MDRADLRVSVAQGDQETMVSVSGDLDVSTVERLSEAVNDQLRIGRGPIVLDLADLTFCDSMGLGTLVVLSRAARAQQRYLVLRNLSPFFARMLDITGVREGLHIAEE